MLVVAARNLRVINQTLKIVEEDLNFYIVNYNLSS